MRDIQELKKLELYELTAEELLELYALNLPIWKTVDGIKLKAKSMSYLHIINCIKLLNKTLIHKLDIISNKEEERILASINIFTKEILIRRSVPADAF